MEQKIQLPKADLLEVLIKECTDFNFTGRTTIVQRLAGKRLTTHAIALEVEACVAEYDTFLDKEFPSRNKSYRTSPTAFELAKSDLYSIYAILFRDHPKYLHILQAHGFQYVVRPEWPELYYDDALSSDDENRIPPLK